MFTVFKVIEKSSRSKSKDNQDQKTRGTQCICFVNGGSDLLSLE